ncbi:hypothetical protein HKCCE2091_18275 [Rhodobacterales bacterium HKCCE2091]|nr:hypothetical protein [Rhodobacterales bacterium HKCCE2091]
MKFVTDHPSDICIHLFAVGILLAALQSVGWTAADVRDAVAWVSPVAEALD